MTGKNEFEKKVDEMSLTDMLKENKNLEKKAEEPVKKQVKVLTVSAREYVDSMNEFMSRYDMVGVVSREGGGTFHGLLYAGKDFENCPQGTEAVVDIKEMRYDYYLYGTAMIRRK